MKKNWKIYVLILLMVLTGVFFYMKEIKTPIEEEVTTPIVFASVEIPANTVIKPSMLVLKEVNIKSLENEKGYYEDLESVIGKRTKFLIYKDEIMRDTRILENINYMNETSTDRKEYSFKIENTEKALSIKEGSFVDIYLIPNGKGLELLKEGKLLFEKRQILYLKDEKFNFYSSEVKDSIPAYLIMDFDDGELVKLLSVDKNLYDFKIVGYGEHLISELLKEKELLKKKEVSSLEDNTELEGAEKTE